MNGIVQFRNIGDVKLGRFGNQLHEYIFARVYAEKIGAKLETGPWIGQRCFVGVNDPPPSLPCNTFPTERVPTGQTNINLNGLFQTPEAQATWTRADAKRIYQFKPELVRPVTRRPLVVAHLRRGDFCNMENGLQVIVKHSFERAIKQYGYDLDSVVWVTDGKPNHYKTTDMGAIRDFIVMCQADALFCSNLCTFSWWAGTIGNAKVFSGGCSVLKPHEITPRNKFVDVDFKPTQIKP